MSNFTYTFADLKRAVQHALGALPDTNLTTGEVVNDALQYYANLGNWRWKSRALNLDSTNAQNFILLPADFETMNTLKLVGSSINNEMQPASLEQIIGYRVSTGSVLGGTVAYCVDYKPQASVTAEPLPLIQVYPTPASTTTGPPYYASGIYLRRIPALSSDTDKPDIPSMHHPALKQLCRAMAIWQEEQSMGSDWALFQDMIGPLVMQDGGMPGYLGRARGGLHHSGGMSLAANTTSIGT